MLDVIAGYKTGGTITGEILIDGRIKDPATWRKISGYAEQQDILNPYLSVLETLRFTANCRLSKDVDKEAVIQRVIKLMDLEDWSDHIIGREKDGEGLPKHARKRVTIANELVALPKILFLDEPTTGLGTNAAALVMNAVRKATDAMGLITVATIHQPSIGIFNAFDDVLLLTKGGKLTYMGESGAPLLNHFSKLAGKSLPERCNPADFCLAVLDDMTPDAAQTAFDQSAISTALVDSIHDEMERGRETEPPAISKERANNFFSEVILLTKRHTIVQWRNPSYCFMRMTSSIIMSLFLGILFYGNKTILSGAVFSIGAIFFLVFVLVIPMQATVVPLVEDRAVLYRETVSGCYGRISYGIGQLLSDQPFHAINTLFMFICFYFLVEFKLSGEAIGYFILMLYLSNWVIQSLGQLYALATPNEESANGLGGLSVMLSVILMGFLITYAAMPDSWQWAYWANLFHYILQGLVTNELAGSDYHLDVSNLLEGVNMEGMNVTNLFAFDGGDETQKEQMSSILGLVSELPGGDGTNPDSSGLSALIECTMASGCFADEEESLSKGFIDCYMFSGLFSDPPCSDQFNDMMSTVDISVVKDCFVGNGIDTTDSPRLQELVSPVPQMEPYRAIEISTHRKLFPGQDPDNTLPEGTVEDNSLDLVLCLAGALLPQDAINKITDTINDLLGIAGFVFEVIENGINIPGELILFVFGWANYNDGEGFTAPFKWYYCMFSVAVFLIAIETFKLISLRYIVWTKR